MYRGTDTSLVFEFDETVDLDKMKEIWITLEVLTKKKTFKSGEDLIDVENEDHKIILGLTQEDTLSFVKGMAEVQIRFLTNDDKALCTEIKRVCINDILQGGVIS